MAKRLAIDDIYPLSPIQQGILFHTLSEPESGLYFVQSCCTLSGEINIEAFKRAWQAVVDHHPVLRTVFLWKRGDEPSQAVHTKAVLPIEEMDWSQMNPDERRLRLEKYLKEDRTRGFSLTQAPLMRIGLIKLSDKEHEFVWSFHHLLMDGWSTDLLLTEAFRQYEGHCKGEQVEVRKSRGYGDYIEWLSTQDMGKAERYWRSVLKGFSSPTSIGAKRSRDHRDDDTREYAAQLAELSDDVSERLKSLAKEHRLTMNTLVQGAWALVLSKYSGQRDVVFGVTTSGRPAALQGCETMIGLFINTLPVRMKLEAGREVMEWLRQIQREQVELREYEYSPLVQVQGWSDVPRGTPLFDTILVFENYDTQADQGKRSEGLNIKVNHNVEKTNYPITAFAVAGVKLTIGIAHYTAHCDTDTITGMFEDFKTILEKMVAHPDQALLEMLPTAAPSVYEQQPPAAKTQMRHEPDRHSNLTRNQLLIWTGQVLQPDVPLYNMAHAYTISSEIEPELFQRAFQEAINAADALRIVIEEVEGIPQQRFLAEFPYQMDYLDFSGLADPHAAFETWARERIQVMFDLGERLFDSVLIKLSQARFVWYLEIHDINTDGWSHSIIFQRVSQCYGRLLNGVAPDLAPLPSFESHTKWEQEYRTLPQYLESEAYWRQQLSEQTEPVTFYGKGLVKKTTRVERVRCDLGVERSRRLIAVALKEGIFTKTLSVSLFNIIAAILLTYAYRHCGIHRLSLGVPFHNRRSEEFRDVVGLLMSVLPLLTTIEAGETFLSLVHKVADAASAALRHCRYAVSNPLQGKVYDVMLNYQTSLFGNFNGAQVETEWIHSGHGNDDLVLQVQDFDRTGSFVLYFDFHCSVFDEQEREQTIKHFVNLIDRFLEDYTQPIERAGFLSDEEKRRILVEFNQTESALPEDQTISSLFESQVERTPNHVALKFESQSLTYAKLNAKANQLAHYLRALGVGPDVFVGICLDRPLEVMVGLLGILKAGGAYVPLDPAYPKQRIAYIVEDAKLPLVLTRERLGANLRRHDTKIVCIETEWPSIAQQSEDNLPSTNEGDNLAYVIYTSGSTGAPKGILVSHKSVINHNLDIIRRANLQPSDRVLQFHSISFDSAVEEIFPTWLSGATLVLRGDRLLTAGELLKLIKRERVTVLDLPTAYWHEWVTELATSKEQLPESLRLLITGGEKASLERFNAWQELGGNRVEWLDGYGPTEATIIATLFAPPANESKSLTRLPIGKPISNTQIYILDELLQPVPIGVSGQIHISGAGLARGYCNRPDLTAEKFIPDPFSNNEGARMYSTGDVGRYLGDGEIEFLGRIDHQLKIRGFRIEPGEIESVLVEQESVAQALVMMREDASLDKRLVAYIVPRSDQPVVIDDLRKSLRERLPDYMQPSSFVVMERLPLNANGKVDRQALPPPGEVSRRDERGEVAEPKDQYELQLINIFEEILGSGPVSVTDNFFELGGHSILALRVVSRIHKQMGSELELSALMKEPTIGGLAGLIRKQEAARRESSGGGRSKSSLVAIQPGGRRQPFHCVHPIGGQVMCYVGLARKMGADQPLYGLEAAGLEEAAGRQESIEGMAGEYVEEVIKAHRGGGYLLGGWSMGGVIAYEMARQMRSKGEAVTAVVLLDTMSPAVMRKLGTYEEDEGFVMALYARSQQRARGIEGEQIRPEQFRGMSEGEQLRYLKGEGIVPEEVSEEYAVRFIEGYRRRQRAMREYRGGGYDGKVVLIRARPEGVEGDWLREEYEKMGVDVRDRALGWEEEVKGEVEVYEVEAEHERMFEEPYVGELAKVLLSCFDKSLDVR